MGYAVELGDDDIDREGVPSKRLISRSCAPVERAAASEDAPASAAINWSMLMQTTAAREAAADPKAER